MNMQAIGGQPWGVDVRYALDPGIRQLVTLLNSHGFKTTDSGDGESKFKDRTADEATLPFPHVFIALPMASMIIVEAQRLQRLLDEYAEPGVPFSVEASYDPRDNSAVLAVYDVDDSRLK